MNTPEIMIVEDEPSIAEVVELYLRRTGYQPEVGITFRISLPT